MNENIQNRRVIKNRRAKYSSVIAAMTCLAVMGITEASAYAAPQYHWSNRASGVKVVTDGSGVNIGGVSADAWALSNQVGPGGGQQVNKGNLFCPGNDANCYFQWSVDGGAEGTSLADQPPFYWPGSSVGRLWLVSKDNSVWYRTSAGWFFMPTNRCEGNGAPITIRQVVGDNSIAVGYNTNIFVIESNGTPSNSVRWWSGSCWWRMPTPSGVPTNIAVWGAGETTTQTAPVISTTTGALIRWTGSAWTTVTTGSGLGVGGFGTVIGMDGTSIWNLLNNGTFALDSWWGSNGPVRNIGSSQWVVRPDGNAFHLEYVGGS